MLRGNAYFRNELAVFALSRWIQDLRAASLHVSGMTEGGARV